jgi:lipopolysaccharide biosynthesis glycosyltransferase
MKAITLTNKGYIKLTDNLLNSIKKNSIDLEVTIGTMDKYSDSYYKKLGYRTNLLTNQNEKKFLRQDSDKFGKYMICKLDMIFSYLSKYEKVLYLDGDIVIKKNITQYLDLLLGEKDLLIQDDININKPEVENLCAGFMYINSNELTKSFFNTDNISEKILMSGLHDQGYVNSNKSKLDFIKLDKELFPNGSYYYKNYESIDPYIVHFNYILGKEKIKVIKKYGEWYT